MPLTYSRPILHGAGLLHTVQPPPRRRSPRPPGFAIGTLNIQDGRGFGLSQAIWAVERGGVDMMLLR